VAERVPGFGEVSTWDSLGAYRLLARLAPDRSPMAHRRACGTCRTTMESDHAVVLD
jgi:hypothetical protein